MDSSTQGTPGIATNRGGIKVGSASPLRNDIQPASNGVAPQSITPATNESNTAQGAQPPATPVGGPKGKEREPRPSPFPDVVKMTESEITKEEVEIGRELESIVEESTQEEKPEIPQEAAEAGLAHAGEALDMPPIQTGPGALPMTFDEASFIRKQNRFHWKNSVAWFAELIKYHWKKIKQVNKNKKN